MKGQSGIEALMAVALIILLLIFSVVTYAKKRSEIDFTREHMEAQKICYEIKNTINQIFADGPGSNLVLNISNKLEGNDFNITVNAPDKIIAIEWDGNVFSCSITTQNVTNSTSSYIFNIGNGTRTIKNIEGVVTIET